MKTRNAITKLITKTMAVAVLAAAGLLCATGWLQPVQAQTGDGSVKFISYASIGMVHGERARLTVSNTEESSGTLSLSFSYYLAHQSHATLSDPFYETEWMQVPRGELRFSEVRREDLKTEGEPKTGRAQMIVRLNMIAPAGSNPEHFLGSVEVTKDDALGDGSTQLDTKYGMIILAAKRSKHLHPISFLPGERLSYTFINPNEEGSQAARVTTYTYDGMGRLISQTDPVRLQPGEWYIVNIKREDLRVPGEELTGRLLVSTVIEVVSMDGSVRPVNLHVSTERVDRSGSSSSGPYFTGSVTVSGDGF
ncbi:MAG TPA: RHS repeat domain-containing protein [Pyrinomonadaceae bacterium]|nr:RHS repeat domain-containing protein [Pyrinomonadaceae bacterium]